MLYIIRICSLLFIRLSCICLDRILSYCFFLVTNTAVLVRYRCFLFGGIFVSFLSIITIDCIFVRLVGLRLLLFFVSLYPIFLFFDFLIIIFFSLVFEYHDATDTFNYFLTVKHTRLTSISAWYPHHYVAEVSLHIYSSILYSFPTH